MQYIDPRSYVKKHAVLPFSSCYWNSDKNATHYHNMIEILYCVKGKAQIHIGTRLYNVSPGELVLINSNELHNIDSTQSGELIAVQFDPELLYTVDVLETKYLFPFILANPENKRHFNINEFELKNADSIIKNILKECDSMNYGFELSVQADIFKLFLQILRCWKQNDKSSQDYIKDIDNLGVLGAAFDFIKNNYSNDITAKDAAKIVSMSYSHFSRTFKSVMKLSFTEYLTQYRLNVAERKLIKTEQSITDIALQCGFCTSSYFIVKFKNKNGMSPLKFRKLFK